MYVLEVSGAGVISQGGVDYKGANQAVLFPADRCTFQTGYSSTKGSYEVTNANFYTGAQDSTDAFLVSLSGTNIEVRLGYLAKTGRFVGITD